MVLWHAEGIFPGIVIEVSHAMVGVGQEVGQAICWLMRWPENETMANGKSVHCSSFFSIKEDGWYG